MTLDKSLRIPVLSVAFFFLVLGAWHGYVKVFEVPAFLLPAPLEVGRQLWEMLRDGTLVYHMGITTGSIVLGFLIGGIGGFLLGYLFSESRFLERSLLPFVMVVQATPKVTLIPLFVIWFGLGWLPKLLLIILSAFFPILVNTVSGFRSVPEEYYELFRIVKATRRQVLFGLKIPIAAPLIAAGAKIAMVQSVIGAIVSEWVSGRQGLGYLLVFGSTQYDSSLLIASIIATTLVGIALYLLTDATETRLVFWQEREPWKTENV